MNSMKSITLAVFGHNDLRGGTMAVPIPAYTPEEIKKAKATYDGEFELPDDQLLSDENFLYVADLWYEEGESLEDNLDYGERHVLLDGSVQGERRKLELIRVPVGFDADLEPSWPLDKTRENRLKAMTKVLVQPLIQGWNDDAYGFVILR